MPRSWTGAVLLTAALLAGCAQVRRCEQPLSLAAMPSVPVGPLPLDVAIGDVNKDGVPDLATADARGSQVSVVLGRGDGTFVAPARTVAVGLVPHMLALSDLDQDGDLDLVATDHDSAGVAVWLNDGQGTFAQAAGSPFAAHGGKPHNHGLAVGDVSGDFIPDVLTSNQEDHSISVLLGDGTGRFSPAPGSPIPLEADPYPLRLGDLDGDGKLDIVVPLIGGRAVAVLRGGGSGEFTPMPGSPYRTLDRPYGIAVADLDADGNLDVLAAHDDTDQMTVLMGSATGMLTPAKGSPLSLGTRIFAMATGDLNGDGTRDVLAGAGDLVMALLARPGRSLSEACRSDLVVKSWTVNAGDLDGDGRIDVVAPDAVANEVHVWLSGAR